MVTVGMLLAAIGGPAADRHVQVDVRMAVADPLTGLERVLSEPKVMT